MIYERQNNVPNGFFFVTGAWGGRSSVSPGASSSSGSSWRSGTPSPPPASSSFSDEGIAMDYEEIHPRKKRVSHRTIYQETN